MYKKIINTRSNPIINPIINPLIFKQFIHRSLYTGGEIVYNKLLENKVEKTFIYSGGAIMPLIDCFYGGLIKYYINTHEQNCGHAATGYAKSSNKTGIAIVTSGPGLTNMITPMLDATNDSTPLVVISGQVPLKTMNTNAFQECPAVAISSPVTKWSYCVQNIEELCDVIDKAFYIANDKKKGSVHIDIPKCILADKINKYIFKKTFVSKENSVSKNKFHISKQLINQLEKVSKIINNAKKPIFYIGKGCNNYSKELTRLILKSNIPVTTTLHAMGVFDENHPLSLKFLGMHGNVAANFAIQDSDCIIAIGSRFDDRTTGNLEYYAPEAKLAARQGRGGIIHVNIEDTEINKVVKSDYKFNCDAKIFIEFLLKDNLIQFGERNDWINRCNKWKKLYPFKYDKLENNKLKTQDIIVELNRQLYDLDLIDKTIITTGVGNHQMMAAQFIYWKKPKTMITSGSLGVMGTGLPYAIGCQLVNPDKLVIDVDGDGSFNHTMSDLKTIVENDLPIKIAIMNDGYQSMVRVWEELFYDGRITATKLERNPEYDKLAEAFGMMSLKVENSMDLGEKMTEFLTYPGPILCDFRVHTDKCLPLVAPGKALDDLIMHEENMENRENMQLKYERLKNLLPPS